MADQDTHLLNMPTIIIEGYKFRFYSSATATGVRFTDSMIYVALGDGREIGVPLSRFPWLEQASLQQRTRWSIEPHGYAVWWDDLDDGIEVCHLPDMQMLA